LLGRPPILLPLAPLGARLLRDLLARALIEAQAPPDLAHLRGRGGAGGMFPLTQKRLPITLVQSYLPWLLIRVHFAHLSNVTTIGNSFQL